MSSSSLELMGAADEGEKTMIKKLTLERAVVIAVSSHEGQTDKGGHPYILHPLRVMMRVSSEDERIVAVLHDVLEDTSLSLPYLIKEGLNQSCVDALIDLTRDDNEEYDAFIDRIAQCQLATVVKMADLGDNMDMSRLKTWTRADEKRQAKYQRAYDRLANLRDRR